MQAQYFHYEILETYNLIELENHKDHRRLRVFYEKGCKCVECGIEATQLALGKDRMNNLHLDVYTDDFYPLTVDHIVPKSLGGSDDISNLQPMCCLCNWRKGNGDRPARVGKRKYQYLKDIPTQIYKEKTIFENYTHDDIQIGDLVYIKTGNKGKSLKEIGKVEEFCINPYNGRDSAKIDNKRFSIYHIKQLFKLK